MMQRFLMSCIGLFFPMLIHAGCNDNNSSCVIQVSAVIENGCVFSSNDGTAYLGELSFGQAPSLQEGYIDANLHIDLGLYFQCTPGISFTMSIDGGQNALDNNRRLAYNGHYLDYFIYLEDSKRNPIGINQPISLSIFDNASGISSINIFSEIYLPGNKPVGTYTDTVQVTFTY